MEVDQRLVNAVFEIAYRSYELGLSRQALETKFIPPHEWREPHMEWVAEQLRLMGIDTKPMGQSWGVIVNKK